MSAEKVVYDAEWFVYRIRKPDGALVGTEYNGLPLAWDTRAQAEEQVELRAERDGYLRWLQWARRRCA